MADLQISLIQTNPFWEDIPGNLELFEHKLEGIESGQVVILPEMFTTGFSMHAKELAESMDGTGVKWMKRMAAEKKIILTGSLIIKEKGNYYNRLLWVLPNGRIAQYDKRHLFSYAEEHLHYTPGTNKLTASVKGWKIGLFICYDLRFPVWLRQPEERSSRFDLMIVMANWPSSRIAQWDTLLKARAIENQCYVAGVNRTGVDGYEIAYNGHSAIYDPFGRRVIKSEEKDVILQQILEKQKIEEVRKEYPFLEDADDFDLKV